MVRALRVGGQVWIVLVVLLIAASYIAIVYFDGWGRFLEIADPFNLINDIAIIVALAPGVALLLLAEKLERKRKVTSL